MAGYDFPLELQRDCAKKLVRRGRRLLEQGARPQAKATFEAATRLCLECAPAVVDCYDTLADSTQDRKLVLYCHREAKRYCKSMCRMPEASVDRSPGGAGHARLVLAEHYLKLSDTKSYEEHDILRAIACFSQALERADNIERPAGHRGRLAAATAWLAQKRGPTWFGHKRRRATLQKQAWDDAVLLLRTPAWDPVQASTWEAVAALSAVSRPDEASCQSVRARVLPLLEDALCRLPSGLGHGNPWAAAQALLGHHKACVGPILDAMRRAVATDSLRAEHLPAALACYDRVLALEPALALAAAADLTLLQARFWQHEHAMGNLVFVGGRFLEAAQKAGDKARGEQVLAAMTQVAEHTPGEGAAHTAIAMFGFVAKRLPDYGVPVIERLLYLARVWSQKSKRADATLPQAIADTLVVCCKKPAPKAVRRVAQAGCASLALGPPGSEAPG